MDLAGIAWKFLTHRHGKPLTFGVAADSRHCALQGRVLAFGELATMSNGHPDACAYGKLAVLGRDGIFTFQTGRSGETTPVFCGNSNAAALALLGAAEMQTWVHGARGARYDLWARAEGGTIAQTWIVPQQDAVERVWRGLPALFLSTLNDYVILLGRLPEGSSPETVRRELLGSSSASKLAVVTRTAGTPLVEFYNSNGKHGALPHTGLATIALAARSASCLQDYLSGELLSYPTRDGARSVRLPGLVDTGRGCVAIEMPPTEVSLTSISMDLAA